jgi:hypothetical protein
MSAGITYNQVASAITNPNTYYLPINKNDNFDDSNFFYDGISLTMIGFGGDVYLYADKSSELAIFGGVQVNESHIYMFINGPIVLTAPNGLRINASTSNTAGSPAGHLNVNVNGSNYKIKLLTI